MRNIKPIFHEEKYYFIFMPEKKMLQIHKK